jgi:phage regulator Rha-like protein
MQNNENFAGNANLFPIQLHEGVHVVDSRLIADALGIDHQNFFATVRKYENDVKTHFGVCLFETDIPKKGTKGGQPQKYALLTENQATFLATLSRNTNEVVAFKAKLILSFAEARKQIQEAHQLLESVQGNISPSKEIAELRQEVHNLRECLVASLQLLEKNFGEIDERIEALENKHQDSKGTLDTTVNRVDKIEERLDFKAVACVYVMYCKRRQWHKLGSSYDAKERKDDFSTVERHLKIVIEIPTSSREEAYALENALKKRFVSRHKEGEWYGLLPEDLAYLHELAQSNRLHLLRTTTIGDSGEFLYLQKQLKNGRNTWSIVLLCASIGSFG